MNELERMNKGLLHNFFAKPELDELKEYAQGLLVEINDPNTTFEDRQKYQKELLGSCEGFSLIMPPFRCDYP